MSFEKLEIAAESKLGQYRKIIALFNPNQIDIQKSVNWKTRPVVGRDVPDTHFIHGSPAVLTMDLFFDTYSDGSDVRDHSDLIVQLTTVENHGSMHRPPICKLSWGKWGVFFTGVMVNLGQRFTLFLDDGTPVRATLNCTFHEFRTAEEDAKMQKTESADVAKTRVVRAGDTLSSIAAVEYDDPTLWRPIAEANHLDDPRHLPPGRILLIPALTGPRALPI